jgi:hypothetical protein
MRFISSRLVQSVLMATTLVAAACTGNSEPTSTSSTVVDEQDGSLRIRICGHVSAYAAATLNSDGSLSIADKKHLIKRGTRVEGEGRLSASLRVCVTAKVDADGELTDPMKVEDDHGDDDGTKPEDCDMMPAEETPPPATEPPPCTSNCGEEPPPCTSNCGEEPGDGDDDDDHSTTIDGTTDLMICGRLDAWVKATADAMGYVTISGHKIDLQKGVALAVDLLVKLGLNVCVSLKLDVNGHVTSGSIVLDLLAAARVHVCGEVHAYVKATASSVGELWIGFPRLQIAAGALLEADAMLKVAAKVCVDASLDLQGRISAGVCTAY